MKNLSLSLPRFGFASKSTTSSTDEYASPLFVSLTDSSKGIKKVSSEGDLIHSIFMKGDKPVRNLLKPPAVKRISDSEELLDTKLDGIMKRLKSAKYPIVFFEQGTHVFTSKNFKSLKDAYSQHFESYCRVNFRKKKSDTRITVELTPKTRIIRNEGSASIHHSLVAKLMKSGVCRTMITNEMMPSHFGDLGDKMKTIYGNAEVEICLKCRMTAPLGVYKKCPKCSLMLHPHCVKNGEPLEPLLFKNIVEEVMKADCILILDPQYDDFPFSELPFIEGKQLLIVGNVEMPTNLKKVYVKNVCANGSSKGNIHCFTPSEDFLLFACDSLKL